MGNSKFCGQKLRLVEENTAKEELERSIAEKKHESSRLIEQQRDKELSIKYIEVKQRMQDKSPEDIELYLYHKTFQLQMDYFNAEETEYYENLLKLERLNRKDNRLKKRIKCKEDKLLGAGSFGTVTRGFCVNNRITMAVKRIHIGGTVDSNQQLNELQKEVELLSELKHPNIVAYFDSERENDYLKIYLEYVDMGSIANMLKIYGPFPEEVVSRYTKQILEGLEYLHYHGIMHRDIKGANILVHSNGNVKLADFGSAKKIKTYASSFTGTVCWMSPEVSLLDDFGQRIREMGRYMESGLYCV